MPPAKKLRGEKPLLTKLTDGSDQEKLRVVQLNLYIYRMRDHRLEYDDVYVTFTFEFFILHNIPPTFTRGKGIRSAMESLITASGMQFEALKQTERNFSMDPLTVIGTVAFVANPDQEVYFIAETSVLIPQSDSVDGTLLTKDHLRSAYDKIKEDNDLKEGYNRFLGDAYD